MTSVAIIAGFFWNVELLTKMRFSRLFATGRLHWVEEVSVRNIREPSFREFQRILVRVLQHGDGPVLVLIANPYNRDHEHLFREEIGLLRARFPTVRIEFPCKIGPTEADAVCSRLAGFFGFSSAGFTITPKSI